MEPVVPVSHERRHIRTVTPIDVALRPEREKRTVMIYVRKGSDNWERTISIKPIPEEADPIDLLDVGFAIGGNSATLTVARTPEFITWAEPEKGIKSIMSEDTGSFEYPSSLNNAINKVERTIVAWLKGIGYIAKFG